MEAGDLLSPLLSSPWLSPVSTNCFTPSLTPWGAGPCVDHYTLGKLMQFARLHSQEPVQGQLVVGK